jgi:hypothetical protein
VLAAWVEDRAMPPAVKAASTRARIPTRRRRVFIDGLFINELSSLN